MSEDCQAAHETGRYYLLSDLPPGGYGVMETGLYVLKCRHCDKVLTTEALPVIVAVYLVHVAKEHFEFLELLRDADDNTIAAAFADAYGRGMMS
jgi:hypothetical protein